MSNETLAYLQNNVLVGFTGERGPAWHAAMSVEGELPFGHFEREVPWADVNKLFGFTAARAGVARVVNGEVARNADGDIIMIDNRIELYHSETGKSFGFYTEDYQEHQYQDVLLGMTSSIISDTLRIGSAGLLKGGAVAWVQVEMPETIDIDSIGEKFRPSLLACSSHNGSIANTFKPVITRVVCDNTLSAGLAEKSTEFKFRHSKNSKEDFSAKVNAARDALGFVEQIAGAYEEEAMRLCNTHVTPAQWDKYLDLAAPLVHKDGSPKEKTALTYASNMRDALDDLWTNDERVSPWRNSAWGVLQAATTYSQHQATVRKVSRQERNFESRVFGSFVKDDAETMKMLEMALA